MNMRPAFPTFRREIPGVRDGAHAGWQPAPIPLAKAIDVPLSVDDRDAESYQRVEYGFCTLNKCGMGVIFYLGKGKFSPARSFLHGGGYQPNGLTPLFRAESFRLLEVLVFDPKRSDKRPGANIAGLSCVV